MRLTQKIFAFLTVTAATLYALPSFAAEGSEDKAGLPQLDTSLFPEQLFWLAVSFGLLYFLMSVVALPGVKRTQVSRQKVMDTELAAASSANEAARAMLASYEKALSDARAKAHATVSAIKLEAAKESAEHQAVQHKELTKRLHEAEAKISASRDAALKDIQGAVSDLANGIVEKMTGIKAGPAQVGR